MFYIPPIDQVDWKSFIENKKTKQEYSEDGNLQKIRALSLIEIVLVLI